MWISESVSSEEFIDSISLHPHTHTHTHTHIFYYTHTQVVISGPFINFLLHNHFITKKSLKKNPAM